MTTPDSLAWIDEKLATLAARQLRRQRRVRERACGPIIEIDGRRLINFGSNDYLALAGDERITSAAVEAMREAGWGGGASPLITGHTYWHERLERRLAEFLGVEAALVFSSGYAANVGAIAAVTGRGDNIFSDEANHASIIDGCRLSGATVHVYRHADAEHLAELLHATSLPGRRLIVTDTVFSMDGDVAPLVEIGRLAKQHGAMLMVDEAHATGVLGATGRGLAEQLGIESAVDIHMGTLSKALGCAGGFVAGSRRLIDWLVNRARSYVFSTAHPAANGAAAIAALDVLQHEPQRRAHLVKLSQHLREELRARGWNLGKSTTQIVPMIVGDAGRTMELANALYDQGFFVPGIRPPTVALGQSRLRISLTAGHQREHIDQLVAAIGEVRNAT